MQSASILSINVKSTSGLNLYCYASNNPITISYSGYNEKSIRRGIVEVITKSVKPSYSYKINLNNIFTQKETTKLIDTISTIYDISSSIIQGAPIAWHYFKYGSIIKDEFKLYGISKMQTSGELANVNLKMVAADIALIGLNTATDMLDSYQRGVSTEGIILGGALTAATGVGMYYLNEGIVWLTTTIGTAICPGVGTGIGFVVGLLASIVVDYFLGKVISQWIDENIK